MTSRTTWTCYRFVVWLDKKRPTKIYQFDERPSAFSTLPDVETNDFKLFVIKADHDPLIFRLYIRSDR